MRPDRQPKLTFRGELARALRQLGIHLRSGTKICSEYAPVTRSASRGGLTGRQARKFQEIREGE